MKIKVEYINDGPQVKTVNIYKRDADTYLVEVHTVEKWPQCGYGSFYSAEGTAHEVTLFPPLLNNYEDRAEALQGHTTVSILAETEEEYVLFREAQRAELGRRYGPSFLIIKITEPQLITKWSAEENLK
jgi:hypothetical protein